MFLQCLPVTLRTLLGKQEPGDIKSMAFGPLVANMEVAEEQPAAQIAAVQRKEPKWKKKLPRKKSGG